VAVRESPIAGRGLFAAAQISKHELVMVWGGRVMSYAESNLLTGRLWHYPVQVWFDTYMGPGTEEEIEPVVYINHSCAPNCGFAGSITVVARQDIAAGQELTYDYGTTDTGPYRVPCACGAPHCRGWIDGNAWRDPEWRSRHAGYISTYIQELIRMEETGEVVGLPPDGLPLFLTQRVPQPGPPEAP
jgi:hypothetical protein